MALILLNLAGGDCVADLERLEADEGLCRVLRKVEHHGLPRGMRRDLERRWRKGRPRTVPTASPVFRYLAAFHDPAEEARRPGGTAFIPAPNEHLRALGRVNRDFVAFVQSRSAQCVATLDMDATLVGSDKAQALYCYAGYLAYQPFNVYWAEQDLVVHSKFSDGNVPAGHQQLRLLQETLAQLPPRRGAGSGPFRHCRLSAGAAALLRRRETYAFWGDRVCHRCGCDREFPSGGG